MKRTAGIISIDVEDYNVMVEYEGHWENDGIGKYEFQGTPGYDKGTEYLVIDKIEPVWVDETPAERVEIKVLLRKNMQEYVEQIQETYRDDE